MKPQRFTLTDIDERQQAMAALSVARPKQFRALQLLAQGLTHEAIAAELGLRSASSATRRLATAGKSLKRLVAEIRVRRS